MKVTRRNQLQPIPLLVKSSFPLHLQTGFRCGRNELRDLLPTWALLLGPLQVDGPGLAQVIPHLLERVDHDAPLHRPRPPLVKRQQPRRRPVGRVQLRHGEEVGCGHALVARLRGLDHGDDHRHRGGGQGVRRVHHDDAADQVAVLEGQLARDQAAQAVAHDDGLVVPLDAEVGEQGDGVGGQSERVELGGGVRHGAVAMSAVVHADDPEAEGQEKRDLERVVIVVADPSVEQQNRDSIVRALGAEENPSAVADGEIAPAFHLGSSRSSNMATGTKGQENDWLISLQERQTSKQTLLITYSVIQTTKGTDFF
ncbi:hypothetical protein PGQ11_001714 [Apiospora arundinis]|uniref:Uncharacterized protein n=1 Tax=Apiospora arundinis TaxID=335852 RepID=A0ABR2JGM1_9PEZI